MGQCESSQNVDQDYRVRQNKGLPPLLITTKTWARESHGLFDYEAKTVETKEF